MASVSISGDVSGAISIAAPSAAGSGVLTLPTGTDTLVGKATTDTLTNKTLVAPALGTPASGVLTNCTGVVAAALPAGSVLQVVSATYSTQATTSTSSFVDTGLTATITPTKNTSKILVLITHNGNAKNTVAGNGLQFKIYRGATDLGTFEDVASYGVNFIGGAAAMSYQDSPATTSATTYKTQFSSRENVPAVFVQYNSSKSTITLMEIQG